MNKESMLCSIHKPPWCCCSLRRRNPRFSNHQRSLIHDSTTSNPISRHGPPPRRLHHLRVPSTQGSCKKQITIFHDVHPRIEEYGFQSALLIRYPADLVIQKHMLQSDLGRGILWNENSICINGLNKRRNWKDNMDIQYRNSRYAF